MRQFRQLCIACALAAGLFAAGCGTTTADRALSGGLLGAAGGAAIGSVTGSAGKGAVIGGVLGAGAGALTRPEDVNLGTPAWRQNHYCVRRAQSGRCLETAPR